MVLDRDFDGFARTSNGMEVAGAGEGTAPCPSSRPSGDAPLTASRRPRKRSVMACMVVGASVWSMVAGASSVRSGV